MLFETFAPFDTMFPSAERVGFLPPADLAVSDHDMVLTMDLPGLSADDLHIEVLDGELVVRGERRRPDLSDGSSWAITERTFGTFERRLALPRGTDPEAVTASMENGVLSLVVPKPETMRPKTIAIGSGPQRRELETATA